MNTGSVDSVDARLLQELQRDARQTNRALATTVGLAPSTTLNRVRELEQRGVITGYHAEVDLPSLGRHLQALVFVRLQPKSADIVDRFLNHVWSLPETLAIDLISGIEDVVIHLAVPDADALQAVVLSEISSFPEVFDERSSLLFERRRRPVVDPL
jgi:DNA-binding Lrp family transcriptional regulator